MTSIETASPSDPPRPRRRPKWLVYLLLGRVSNLPTIWTNCLAGVILAGHPFDASLVWLPVAMSLMYIGGMFLNDAFDERFDRQVRSERPIPAGDIRAGQVYVLGFAMLAASIWAVASNTAFKTEAIVWAVILAALIVYYNYRHKRDPLSPLVMALCRVMVYFVAAASVETALSTDVLIGATALTGYLIGLTYVAKQENLSEVKNLWPLLFLSLPLLQFFRGANLLAGMALVGWALYALSFLIEKPRRIATAVVSLIAGIALLDAMTISTVPEQGMLALAAGAAFILTLAFQRFIPGT